ncbi:hypothetical protein SNE40_009657 [Patella caerulea]|uniref:RNA-directed DNA polymerase from mobile element jockey-like n=1 Tax=Patella caerulea TaxID=87958 RepID=A0AAN8JZ18_PATCE
MIKYSVGDLQSFRNHPVKLNPSDYNNLKSLHLLKSYRGKRAGSRKQKPIDVHVTYNNLKCESRQRGVCKSNLLSIATTHDPDIKNGVKLGLINAQSVYNKTIAINEFINEKSLDLLAITETWLSDNDTVIINELCGDDFDFINLPRQTRGGGVGLLFRNKFECIRERVNTCFNFFEFIQLFLNNRLRLVILYHILPH